MISQEQQEKLLSALMKKPENANCADCNSKSPCCKFTSYFRGFPRFWGLCLHELLRCSSSPWPIRYPRQIYKTGYLEQGLALAHANRQYNYQQILRTFALSNHQQVFGELIFRKPNINTPLTEIKRFVHEKYVRKLYANR